MGKASSAKKVARVARSGGGSRRTGQRRALGFPLTIGAIVVLGTVLVLSARSNQAASARPQIYTGSSGDHWHAAYGFYLCDHFATPPSDGPAGDQLGIHTHGDGVIHIHPFVSSSAGTNAQLGLFLDDIGATVSDDKIELPDGTVMEEGKDKCGDKDAIVEVAYWRNADDAANGDKPTTVFTEDFDKIRFKEDRAAFTIAFLPEGDTVPAPDTIPTLDNLSDVGSVSTSIGEGSSTTAPPDSGSTSSTDGSSTTGSTDSSSSTTGDTTGSTTSSGTGDTSATVPETTATTAGGSTSSTPTTG